MRLRIQTIPFAFWLSFMVLLMISTESIANSTHPIRVQLRGLVCLFCARGLSQTLTQQQQVDHFEIRMQQRDVLIWPKNPDSPPTGNQIVDWIKKSGLEVSD